MCACALPLLLVPLDTRERACLDEAAWALVLCGGHRAQLTLHHCGLGRWGLALVHRCLLDAAGAAGPPCLLSKLGTCVFATRPKFLDVDDHVERPTDGHIGGMADDHVRALVRSLAAGVFPAPARAIARSDCLAVLCAHWLTKWRPDDRWDAR